MLQLVYNRASSLLIYLNIYIISHSFCICIKIKKKYLFLQCYKLLCGESFCRRFIGYHYMHAGCCQPGRIDGVESR